MPSYKPAPGKSLTPARNANIGETCKCFRMYNREIPHYKFLVKLARGTPPCVSPLNANTYLLSLADFRAIANRIVLLNQAGSLQGAWKQATRRRLLHGAKADGDYCLWLVCGLEFVFQGHCIRIRLPSPCRRATCVGRLQGHFRVLEMVVDTVVTQRPPPSRGKQMKMPKDPRNSSRSRFGIVCPLHIYSE